MTAQRIRHQSDRGLLLTDGHVEAVDVRFLLREDRIQADGGLARLTVADDQLALTAADGRHGVDGFQARRHGLMHALARNDARGLDFHRAHFLGLNGAETVDGLTQGVEHAPHDLVAHRHGEDLAGTLDRIAFLDARVRTEQGDADVVLFEVEHHAHDAAGKLQQLHGHGVLHAVYASDAVADIEHSAGFAHFYALLVVFDLILNDLAYLFRFDLHVLFTPLECLPKDRQLRAQTCVQHPVANLEHHSSKDGCVNVEGQLDAGSGFFLQRGLQLAALRISQFHGGGEVAADNAFGLVQKLAEAGDNLAQAGEALFVGQQETKVSDGGIGINFFEKGLKDLLFLFTADNRAFQRLLQLGRGFKQAPDGEQIIAVPVQHLGAAGLTQRK